MICGENLYCENPAGPKCGPGGDIVDAGDPDGTTSGACTPAASMTSDQSLALVGVWFAGDHASQRAMFYDGTAIRTYEGNFDASGGKYVPALPQLDATLRAPRLAPGGAEMFLKIDDAGAITFGRSTRVGPTKWTAPDPLTFTTSGPVLPSFADGDNISPPTLTDPRRLIISGTFGYHELVETSDAQHWSLVSTTAGGTLFETSFVGEASLSPDGLKLIFLGNRGGTINAFYVTRPSTMSAFAGSAMPLPHAAGNSPITPFLSADCKHFYYTAMPAGDVRHVVLP